MFAADKDKLVDGLRRLRRSVCCYMSESFCDCKYGAAGVGSGEKTGCPELRLAALIFATMRPDEYADLLARSKCVTDAQVIEALHSTNAVQPTPDPAAGDSRGSKAS